jgi:uncharacterized protein YfdQ (DUF2303 family)
VTDSKTDFPSLLADLNAGIVQQQIEHALSDVALAVATTGKPGEVSLVSEQQDLKVKRTAMEEVEASGQARPLPNGFIWSGAPYEGFGLRDVQLRLSLRTGGEGPALMLRIAAAGRLAEELGDELVSLIRAKVTAPILRGTFSLAG